MNVDLVTGCLGFERDLGDFAVGLIGTDVVNCSCGEVEGEGEDEGEVGGYCHLIN